MFWLYTDKRLNLYLKYIDVNIKTIKHLEEIGKFHFNFV